MQHVIKHDFSSMNIRHFNEQLSISFLKKTDQKNPHMIEKFFWHGFNF